MTERKKNEIPPLVNLKVSNPVEYLKIWWKKIISNEGVDLKFRIHPLTAIAMALVIASVGFGVGRFTMPFDIPFFKYDDLTSTPRPSPSDWKETAFIGTLQYSLSTSKYFLTTTSASEAINIQVTNNISLESLVGKRILAIGSYNKQTRTLVVSDVKDMEILSKTPIPLPTNSPNPSETPQATQVPSVSPTPVETTSP